MLTWQKVSELLVGNITNTNNWPIKVKVWGGKVMRHLSEMLLTTSEGGVILLMNPSLWVTTLILVFFFFFKGIKWIHGWIKPFTNFNMVVENKIWVICACSVMGSFKSLIYINTVVMEVLQHPLTNDRELEQEKKGEKAVGIPTLCFWLIQKRNLGLGSHPRTHAPIHSKWSLSISIFETYSISPVSSDNADKVWHVILPSSL